MDDDREEVVLRHMLVHRCVCECVFSGTGEQTAMEGGTVLSPFWL